MPFDIKQFENTSFQTRQEAVELPALAGFFGDEEKPEWTVRGLTHAELARAEEAIASTKDVEALVSAMAGKSKEKADAITGLLGVTGDDVPRETKKRVEHLVMASVNPAIEHSVAVKLAECFPIEFGLLSNKILQLTGLGKVQAQVKQKPSGK